MRKRTSAPYTRTGHIKKRSGVVIVLRSAPQPRWSSLTHQYPRMRRGKRQNVGWEILPKNGAREQGVRDGYMLWGSTLEVRQSTRHSFGVSSIRKRILTTEDDEQVLGPIDPNRSCHLNNGFACWHHTADRCVMRDVVATHPLSIIPTLLPTSGCSRKTTCR